MIIIDTDVLIEILDKKSEKGDAALKKIEDAGEGVPITVFNLHEIAYGLYKYGKDIIKEIEQMEILGYTRDDAILSAKLELECEKRGKKVSRIDSMIASIAINRNARIFTFNKKHFQAFGNLSLL
ncbi:MAG TPA: type II toxin-antitoxin system VapC family toxin [Thermoplasmatales archaeon]|nr:type II toxin-antitoxin system VapC family toxin [Thermoplasmatales archaeon]